MTTTIITTMRNEPLNATNRTITPADVEAAGRLKTLWKERAKKLGLTQEVMADKMGITQGAVSQYLNGKISLNYRAVVAFATELGCQDTDIRSDLPEQWATIRVVKRWPVNRREGRLPYLDAEQIPAWLEGKRPDVRNWIACPAENLSPRAFVTVVHGVAMSPQIDDGAFVFVDPDEKPGHGSMVLVMMPQPAVRKLQIDGDMQLLATTGVDWPGPKLMPLPEDAVIAGIVAGKWVPM